MRSRISTARVLSRVLSVVVLLAAFAPAASAQLLSDWRSKLDPVLQQRAFLLTGQSRVIVRAAGGSPAPVTTLVRQLGGSVRRPLSLIAGTSVTLPNAAIARLAMNAQVAHISLDRAIAGSMERTGAAVGATTVRQELGVDGSGVGIAIIDSGVFASHDDLSTPNRVEQFV